MKYVLALLSLLASANAWSCSCLGIATIEETIARTPILVEGQVLSLEQTDTPLYGKQTLSATLRVTRLLKGQVAAETITVGQVMCYASLRPDIMRTQHIYILPLVAELADGKYQMADCAHSGLELIDGKLYTIEYATGRESRLQFFMKYSDFGRRYGR